MHSSVLIYSLWFSLALLYSLYFSLALVYSLWFSLGLGLVYSNWYSLTSMYSLWFSWALLYSCRASLQWGRCRGRFCSPCWAGPTTSPAHSDPWCRFPDWWPVGHRHGTRPLNDATTDVPPSTYGPTNKHSSWRQYGHLWRRPRQPGEEYRLVTQ